MTTAENKHAGKEHKQKVSCGICVLFAQTLVGEGDTHLVHKALPDCECSEDHRMHGEEHIVWLHWVG